MIRYSHTDDTHTDVDDAHEEYSRYVPAHLVCGTEVEVSWEDHDFEETNAMIHDIAQSVAYAVRMSL
jgi:hypothetical protein